ncbi:SEC-C metal-binding domain-containing protein [Marinobacterium aestuariivivens]|uniref:SEC-C metal-binding domain-containing protein n=1 Tax=Marinobacterium aestuariivivens TaxID=1698799 RepID=A0ABW1ZWZ0_9GAMM
MTEFEPEEGPLLLEELLQDAARQIFEHENFERFSRWLRDNFDHYVTFELLGESPFDEGFSPEGLQLLAGHLAREIWKYMPLPGNRFRPRPLPKLKPNDPCPCGSGMKYKQCCERLPSDLALPLNAGVIWVTAIPALQELGLLEQAIASHQVPFEGLIEVAVGHFEEAQYRKAAALLEPMLTVAQAPKSTLLHDYALNLLCNCYDALGFNRKKRRLLDTIVQQAPRSELRGAAWQRLATVLADEGDHEAAWQAFKHAQRDTPHSESLGVLEVQLLVSQGRLDEVAPRADFWRRRLLKSGLLPEDPNIRMLEGFADNPLEMMLGMTGSDDLLELLDWMASMQARPVTPYGYQGMMAEDDEPPGGVLLAPTSLKKVAAAWRRVCPLDKPFGTGPVPVPEQDVWAPEAFERWMKVLRRYPEAWDDLDILDDLAALLMDDQLWGDPAVQQLLEKVLLRARNIVAQSVPEGAGLPWGQRRTGPPCAAWSAWPTCSRTPGVQRGRSRSSNGCCSSIPAITTVFAGC